MSTLAVKPGRGLRARPAVPDPHRAGPRCSGFPNSFYAQDQQDECDCRYSGSAVVWPPEETASRGINISYRNVNGGMDTGAWLDQGQALRSKSTQAWAPALARRFRSGRLEGRRRRSPDSKAVGAGSRFSSGRCADRRARSSASPNGNFGGIRPTARGASPSRIRPRPSSRRLAPPALRPSEQTPAHHGMPVRSSARRRLPQTEPSSSWIVTSCFRLPPGGRQSVFGPERQSDRAPQRSSFHRPVSAGFGHRISEGAGQKAALAGEQF